VTGADHAGGLVAHDHASGADYSQLADFYSGSDETIGGDPSVRSNLNRSAN
jgi:hypothetical protein